MITRVPLTLLALAALCAAEPAPYTEPPLADYSHAVIVPEPGASPLEQKTATILREEIEKRTGIALKVAAERPAGGEPVITLATGQEGGAEGYALTSQAGSITIRGHDPRGVLFGAGRLLREMRWKPGQVQFPAELKIVSAPAVPLRGHQLGYRPKVNAYDAWSPEQYDQYIRELALFGVNSIEILPPRTDDQKTSPHMKLPPMEMMVRLSEIIDSYGLDVWIWYPNMGKDYTSEAGQQSELAERDEIFSRLRRVDHVLVPGGDPGNLHPDVYFPWMDKMAAVLRKHHPSAKIWVSPQAFDPTPEWLASFYRHVNEKPAWLGGVTYGPWIQTPLPEMRKIVDAALPIRNYPDITHNVDCQFPVPAWDLAFALTEHRECYNPRPEAMKWIHNLYVRYTCGSLTYSEGINDDVNKFVWSSQDWDPSTPVVQTLQEYCRLFIDPGQAGELAEGFLELERNWQGPLAKSTQVRQTLQHWQRLEAAASPEMKGQFRFQMGLLRACYDSYIQQRLGYETGLETMAREVIAKEAKDGTFAAMAEAEGILRQARLKPVAQALKEKCFILADRLFREIGSQTSVPRHDAENRTRGAFMDGIDEPLNNASWLKAQFRKTRDLTDEPARLAALEAMLHRTDPGPGAFYDSAGEPGHLVNDVPWKDDPGTLKSPRVNFYYESDRSDDREIPLAWRKQADTLYNTPLRFAYEGLDPKAEYTVKATLSGRTSHRMKLMANDHFLISDHIESHKPVEQEFKIPREATAGGKLELEWSAGQGERSCEVAEIWLIKHPVAP